MTKVTEILNSIERGDQQAAAQLLPLVYNELRQLAAHRMRHEPRGGTLDATALVHEAYLRLVGESDRQKWDNRAHFFSAAAEAMRRILVEAARRRMSEKRGGELERHDLNGVDIALAESSDDVVAISESLDRLEHVNPTAAQLVKLRYFGGFTMAEIAEMLQIAPRTVDNVWAYARAWLAVEVAANRRV
jgi:RNA polymerase sigma factor (TIGR02999 family)